MSGKDYSCEEAVRQVLEIAEMPWKTWNELNAKRAALESYVHRFGESGDVFVALFKSAADDLGLVLRRFGL